MKKLFLILLFNSIAIFCFGQSPIINSIGGSGIAGYSGDGGPSISAKLNRPLYVNVNRFGEIYVSDFNNSVVRKIDTSGNISTFAGNGTIGFSGDGGPATAAKLKNCGGVAFDNNGNVFIADWGNHCIRKVNNTGIITRVAGTGMAGYTGDGGAATNAKLNLPTNLKVDTAGNLYIADHTNNVIRKVDTSGVITTIAGNNVSGYSGDGGPATAAQFYFPFDVRFDKKGNLFVVDCGNNVIRKINPSGIISTVAGNGINGYTGDGVAATATALYHPASMAIDNDGKLIIADVDNYRIRVVDTFGIITTVAGDGTTGIMGDGGPATAAQLRYPQGVDIDSCGNVFIADVTYHRIRKVVVDSFCVYHTEHSLNVKNKINDFIIIYPNPTNHVLHIDNLQTNAGYRILSIVGAAIQHGLLHTGSNELNIRDLPPGMYLLEVNENSKRTIQKIVKE